MGLFKRKKALESVPSADQAVGSTVTLPASSVADTATQGDKEAVLEGADGAAPPVKPVAPALPPQASNGLEPKPSFASDTPAPSTSLEPSSSTTKPGEPAGEPAPAPPTKPLPPAKFHLTLDQICQGVFVAYILFQLLLFKLFRPAFFTTCASLALGFGAGMGLSYLFYQNKRRKRELNEVLSEDPGVKGMQCLLKEMPSWVSYTDTEKMEWMNRLLHELWPHYDRAICQTIKETVEPMIAMYCPPTFKRIFFKHLTFGDAPFRIENIKVEENRKDEVVMEVGVRWCGDANITIGVDLPAGGDATRMCPKVSDISFVGTARVALKPLCNTIPGFGGIMVSLKKPPIVKFKLDFGKALGSGYTAGLIRQFLDPLIRSTMVDMLVWPQRIVSPVIWGDPVIDAAIEKMQLRHVGVMRITVDRCRNLNSYDLGGKSDPVVELSIDPLHRTETKCVKHNLNPEFGETFFLLVQEPTDQILRVTVFDVDLINVAGAAKDLLSINFVKGITSTITNSVNHKTFMGRSAIQVRGICQQEGREVPIEHPLGRGDWSDLNGPGKGEGTVHLTCTYKSFPSITMEDVARATKGILLVDLKRVADLELAAEATSFYVIVKVGKTERRTQIVRGSKKDFSFGGYYGSRFAFYDVDITADLKIKLREYTMIGSDDSLGKIEPIPVAEIAESKDHNEAGFYLIDDRPTLAHQRHGMPNRTRCQLTEVDRGRLYAEVRFVPHFELSPNSG